MLSSIVAWTRTVTRPAGGHLGPVLVGPRPPPQRRPGPV